MIIIDPERPSELEFTTPSYIERGDLFMVEDRFFVIMTRRLLLLMNGHYTHRYTAQHLPERGTAIEEIMRMMGVR